MQEPDLNAIIRDLNHPTVLAPEDDAYLTKMVAAIRSGKRAVVIVEETDEKTKFMFSSASRPEAVSMLGKVIEATGRRLQDDQ